MMLSILMGLGAVVAGELDEEVYLVLNEGPVGEETRYLVLEDEAPWDWFGQQRRFVGYHAAVAPLNESVGAHHPLVWGEAMVELFDEEGLSCPGQVVEVGGLVRAYSLFWLSQGRVERGAQWNDRPVDESAARRITELGGAPLLVAEVELFDPLACEMGEPVWARQNYGTAQPLAPVRIDGSQNQVVVRELRDLYDYEVIQQRFEDQVPPDERVGTEATWSRYWGAKPQVWAFSEATTERTFAMVVAQAGMGCGEFFGELTQLFELIEVDGTPRALPIGTPLMEAMIPMAMVARPGSQMPDIVGWSTDVGEAELLVTHQEGRREVLRRAEKISYECGC